MKDLLTTIASVLVLMMFLMQFTADQVTYTKMMGAEYAVRNFRIENEAAAEISAKSADDLRARIAAAVRCAEAEVTVHTGPDGTYRVEAPIRGVIGPVAMLGITDEENRFLYTAEGSVRIRNEEPDDHPGADDPDEPAAGISDGTEREDLEEPSE